MDVFCFSWCSLEPLSDRRDTVGLVLDDVLFALDGLRPLALALFADLGLAAW